MNTDIRNKTYSSAMGKVFCVIALLMFFAGIANPLYAQAGNSCEPTTAVEDQKRTKMKHRKPASKGTKVIAATIKDILDWETPDNIVDKEVKSSSAPIDELEDEVFEVEGDLWRVALEANDCDYHLELSEPGGNQKATRVIVEIPDDPGYISAREDLLKALEPSDREKLEGSGETRLSKPVRLRVRGSAFFDAAHYSTKFNAAKPGKCKFSKEQKLKRGNGHGTCAVGTLWELHPIWRVEAAP